MHGMLGLVQDGPHLEGQGMRARGSAGVRHGLRLRGTRACAYACEAAVPLQLLGIRTPAIPGAPAPDRDRGQWCRQGGRRAAAAAGAVIGKRLWHLGQARRRGAPRRRLVTGSAFL